MDNNSLTIEQVILDSQSGIFTTYDPDTRQVMVGTKCPYCNEEFFRVRDEGGFLKTDKCQSCSIIDDDSSDIGQIDEFFMKTARRLIRLIQEEADKSEEPLFIEDWVALDKIPKESPTHILEVDVDMCNGYLTPKEGGRRIYLSTHSFYGTGHRNTTKILQKCGFNVTINNWDKDKGEA